MIYFANQKLWSWSTPTLLLSPHTQKENVSNYIHIVLAFFVSVPYVWDFLNTNFSTSVKY